ncbi:hypothetical protein TSMEX_004917, partial [Taenia solium]
LQSLANILRVRSWSLVPPSWVTHLPSLVGVVTWQMAKRIHVDNTQISQFGIAFQKVNRDAIILQINAELNFGEQSG